MNREQNIDRVFGALMAGLLLALAGWVTIDGLLAGDAHENSRLFLRSAMLIGSIFVAVALGRRQTITHDEDDE